MPQQKLVVQRVPTGAEKGSANAYYQQGAMDGSRPGTFFANLRDVGETATWSMKTLAYHEGLPGHHSQISTALKLKDLPLIRQQTLYGAYAEGWALYAERFAAEIGMYKGDPLGDLGRLESEIFRAARLVVDTGLHAKGLPGQACAYKVGQKKILELRERARLAMGPKLDVREFHAVVLENGGVPLTVLEKLVDSWVSKTLRS